METKQKWLKLGSYQVAPYRLFPQDHHRGMHCWCPNNKVVNGA